MVASRIAYSGSQSRAVVEGDYVGEYIISDYDKNKCHDNLVLSGGATGIKRNSVVAEGGRFKACTFKEVHPGETVKRGCLTRGPVEVSLVKLNFPIVTDAADGADAGTDNTAENAAATAALKVVLLADMKAAGIIVRAR